MVLWVEGGGSYLVRDGFHGGPGMSVDVPPAFLPTRVNRGCIIEGASLGGPVGT